MLILSEADLRKLLPMRDVIDAVERGFRAVAQGGTTLPQRLQMAVPGGVFLYMPAYASLAPVSDQVGPQDVAGIKIASVFANNRHYILDVVQAAYLLLDGRTGVPLSLMDGRFLTALRTAATSALATRWMAVPGNKRLGLFGAGVLAEFHAYAMSEVAEIDKIAISSRTLEKAEELARRIKAALRIDCDVLPPDQVASTADLICTCTTASTPVFAGNVVQEGTHINAVGAFTPDTRELDSYTVQRAIVVIDANEAAGSEAGDVLIPIAQGAITKSHIRGTLGDLVSGKITGRDSPRDVTLFKSCGVAIEDLVTAHLAYLRAKREGLGLKIDL
jgi:ornithine cyclodeaminase/alanine dehydrogenase